MTLWTIIRDFFVQYIFGGLDSVGNEYGSNFIGMFSDSNGTFDKTYTNYLFLPIGNNYMSGDAESYLNAYLSMGDWLSTTATIITLCAICVFLFLFVRWLFRLTAGLFQARG